MENISQNLPKQDIRNYLSSYLWLVILVIAIVAVIVGIFVIDIKNSKENKTAKAVPTITANNSDKGKFTVQNRAVIDYARNFMLAKFWPSEQQVIDGEMVKPKDDTKSNQKLPYQRKLSVGGTEFTFFAKQNNDSVLKVGVIKDIENGKADFPSVVSYFRDYFIMPANIGEEFWDTEKAANNNVSYKLVYDNPDGSRSIKLAKQISDVSVLPNPIIRLISCSVSPSDIGYLQKSCLPRDVSGSNK